MAQLLLPLSLLGKTIPSGYMPLESYATILLVVVAMYTLIKRPATRLSVKEFWYMLFFLALFFVTQLISMVVSKIIQPQYTGLSFSGVVKSTFMLGIVFILMYMIVTIAIQNVNDVNLVFKGIDVAMWIVLVICILQLLYIKLGIGKPIITLIATLFEERGGTSIATWYSQGSYVATTGRINGLKQETGFLAAQLLILFVPYLLTRLRRSKLEGPKKVEYRVWIPWLLIVIVLFQSGSTTAMLELPIVLIMTILIYSNGWRQVLSFVGIVIIFLVGIISLSPSFTATLNSVVFEKFSFSNTSFVQRMGSGVTMLKIFVKSLGLGVGYNNGGKLSYLLAPQFMRYNPEFNIYWPTSGSGFFAVLSIITGWLAQFGIIFCGTIFYGIYRVVKSVNQRLREENNNGELWMYAWYLRYFLIFLVITSFMSFDWMHPTYLITFLALIRIFNVLEKDTLLEEKF